MRLPRGRPARPAHPAWNVTKTALQTIAFWAVFLGVLPGAIAWLESRWPALPRPPRLPALGAGGFALFGALGLASGWTMAVAGAGTPMPQDCPRRLVLVGPYRFVRNPMALAGLAQGVGVGLWLGSPGVLLYVLIGGVLWNVLVRPWEEADLAARFGAEYQAYRRGVRCWIPRLTAYSPQLPTGSTP